MAKLTTCKNILIGGEFHIDEGESVEDLKSAGASALDRNGMTDIILFQGNDGKWYVGSFEFCISPANPKLTIDTLINQELAECDNCGNIEPDDGMNEVKDLEQRCDKGGPMPAGECSKCGALSYTIGKKRATELAKGTK
jgi:hypothetical protein